VPFLRCDKCVSVTPTRVLGGLNSSSPIAYSVRIGNYDIFRTWTNDAKTFPFGGRFLLYLRPVFYKVFLILTTAVSAMASPTDLEQTYGGSFQATVARCSEAIRRRAWDTPLRAQLEFKQALNRTLVAQIFVNDLNEVNAKLLLSIQAEVRNTNAMISFLNAFVPELEFLSSIPRSASRLQQSSETEYLVTTNTVGGFSGRPVEGFFGEHLERFQSPLFTKQLQWLNGVFTKAKANSLKAEEFLAFEGEAFVRVREEWASLKALGWKTKLVWGDLSKKERQWEAALLRKVIFLRMAPGIDPLPIALSEAILGVKYRKLLDKHQTKISDWVHQTVRLSVDKYEPNQSPMVTAWGTTQLAERTILWNSLSVYRELRRNHPEFGSCRWDNMVRTVKVPSQADPFTQTGREVNRLSGFNGSLVGLGETLLDELVNTLSPSTAKSQ